MQIPEEELIGFTKRGPLSSTTTAPSCVGSMFMNMYGHSITQAEHFRDTVASALQHKQLPSSMGRDMDSAAS